MSSVVEPLTEVGYGSTCPICGEVAVLYCRCPKSDSKCANDHWWHLCLVHNRVVLGPCDHTKDPLECSCSERVENG